MRIERVKEIADAVLYEGYLLYPYRASALKNRQRWTIGVVYPHEYSIANESNDPWFMQTECLLTEHSDNAGSPSAWAGRGGSWRPPGSHDTPPGRTRGDAPTPLPDVSPAGMETHCALSLDIHVRFLHLLRRTTTQATTEEGIEREISMTGVALHDLLDHPRVVEITFPAQHITEDMVVREQYPISGTVRLSAERVDDTGCKLCVRIENTTPETGDLAQRHNAVLCQSFVSTHTIMQVQQGAFISLLEPPEAWQAAVQGCQNLRTWPVLVGDAGETDVLLSSPIILYDYPQIAPESPGALFDGTEIDEILALRILTLTEEEKAQIRQGDKRVRELLARTEALTPAQFMQLHGTIRSLRPVDAGEGL